MQTDGSGEGEAVRETETHTTHRHTDTHMDVEWMPAILAHLEGRGGRPGDGGGVRNDALSLDEVLPERLSVRMEEEGGVVLAGLEALSKGGEFARREGRGGTAGNEGAVTSLSVLSELISVLPELTKELRRELAGYYSALRGSVRDAASQEPLQSRLIKELCLLQLIVASFDAQLSVLNTPKGALALAARRSVSMLAGSAAADVSAEGEAGRVMELVRELERVCVAGTNSQKVRTP
jgi:hypothetical protein